MNRLERRIIDISYEHKLSHIGSNLVTVNFLDHTYKTKDEKDQVILGNAHAGLALYVVLEDQGKCDAEEMLERHGIHSVRDPEHGVEVSGGSLGQAETIALGMAMANKERDVYLITSDGACAEGAVWETLKTAREQRLENFRVAVIANGYGAYGKIDVDDLDTRLNAFYPTLVVRANMFKWPDWLQGLDAHYAVMNDEMYKEITDGENK